MVMTGKFEQFRGGNPHDSEDKLFAQGGARQGLSQEEEARLRGHLVFPDNLAAADLYRRSILGEKLTPKEVATLEECLSFRRFIQRANSALKELEATGPNVEQVAMSQGKALEVSPGDDEKIIWTFGLGGSYACLVFTEHPDGTRNAVLTHYPETKIPQNLKKLRELIGQSGKMKEASTQQVVLMAPGKWVEDPITKELSFRAKDEQIVDSLAIAIQAALELGANVKLELYLEEIDERDQRKLLVYVPPVGKGEARYETWFSDGTLGTQEPKN
jgi:hypothetical protein